MDTKEYRLLPNGFKEIRKQLLLKLVPLVFIAGATGLFIAHKTSDKFDITTFYLAVPIASIAIVIGLNRGLNRQKELMESYVLTVDENSIKREQFNTPVIHIYKREVKEITKNKNGSFSIKTSDKTECITVPAQLENSKELEAELLKIIPISSKATSVEKFTLPLAIGVLLAMAAVFIVKDKLIVTIAGTIVALVLVWSLYEGNRSKGIDKKTKRGMLYVVIVLIAVIYKVISVLIN
jgi:hypothetical protein